MMEVIYFYPSMGLGVFLTITPLTLLSKKKKKTQFPSPQLFHVSFLAFPRNPFFFSSSPFLPLCRFLFLHLVQPSLQPSTTTHHRQLAVTVATSTPMVPASSSSSVKPSTAAFSLHFPANRSPF